MTIFKVETWRLREVMDLAQGLTASQWQSQVPSLILRSLITVALLKSQSQTSRPLASHVWP